MQCSPPFKINIYTLDIPEKDFKFVKKKLSYWKGSPGRKICLFRVTDSKSANIEILMTTNTSQGPELSYNVLPILLCV